MSLLTKEGVATRRVCVRASESRYHPCPKLRSGPDGTIFFEISELKTKGNGHSRSNFQFFGHENVSNVLRLLMSGDLERLELGFFYEIPRMKKFPSNSIKMASLGPALKLETCLEMKVILVLRAGHFMDFNAVGVS